MNPITDGDKHLRCTASLITMGSSGICWGGVVNVSYQASDEDGTHKMYQRGKFIRRMGEMTDRSRSGAVPSTLLKWSPQLQLDEVQLDKIRMMCLGDTCLQSTEN